MKDTITYPLSNFSSAPEQQHGVKIMDLIKQKISYHEQAKSHQT